MGYYALRYFAVFLFLSINQLHLVGREVWARDETVVERSGGEGMLARLRYSLALDEVSSTC